MIYWLIPDIIIFLFDLEQNNGSRPSPATRASLREQSQNMKGSVIVGGNEGVCV